MSIVWHYGLVQLATDYANVVTNKDLEAQYKPLLVTKLPSRHSP